MSLAKNLCAYALIANSLWNTSYAVAATTTINAEEILDNRSALRGTLSRSLQDARVFQKLAELGVNADEVKQRLAAMTEEELAQVQQGLQRQAGGDVLVISATTLVIVLLVIIILILL